MQISGWATDSVDEGTETWLDGTDRSPTLAVGRGLGISGIGVLCMLIPALGEHRVWIGLLLICVTAPAAYLGDRYLPAPWCDRFHPPLDIASILVSILLAPIVWVPGAVAGAISLASASHVLGRLRTMALTVALAGGLALTAPTDEYADWVLVVIVIPAAMVPVATYSDFWQARRQEALNRVGLLVRSSAAMLWDFDATNYRLLSIHGEVEAVTGYPRTEVLTRFADHIHPDDIARMASLTTLGRVDELMRFRRADGEWRYMKVDGMVRDIGSIRRATGVIFDVTELERSRVHLREQLGTDGLTGLRNREGLTSFVDDHRDAAAIALLIVDLDRFKDINDTLGHVAGDAVIVAVGNRLHSLVEEYVAVARLGGDEFGLVVVDDGSDVPLERCAQRLAHRVDKVFDDVFAVDDMELTVAASVGIAVGPPGGWVDLVRHADIAMYQAKRAGNGPVTYRGQGAHLQASRLEDQTVLARALEEQVELWFQPVIDVATRSVAALEGLARWRHPGRGIVPPDELFSVAASAGVTERLERHVLALAVRRAAELASYRDPISVSVNLTARALWSPQLVGSFTRLLSEWPTAMGNLTIEITEQAVLEDLEGLRRVLLGLKETGTKVSLDDYGTGYSSLIRLRRLPIDEIKIDRSFVSGILEDTADAAIVRSTIQLAADLGLRAVAEGVETHEVADQLAAWHCPRIQGYLYARPAPFEELDLLPRAVAAATD